MRTRVKICGFTRPDDALAAVRLGADAIGLVFYPPSPRNVGVEQARAIVASLPPFVTVVGLFVDASQEYLYEVTQQVRIDLLQFHGDERPEACAGGGRPYIKAIRMRHDTDLLRVAEDYSDAAGLLLDADNKDAKGGTGTSFDWAWVPSVCPLPIILAGGLRPDNVAAALMQVNPYAVDVSSGVEATKGVKDGDKMAEFLREVQRFDHAKLN
ncbi:phosphoribosylanthranilate isomerase [Methylococcus sp. EFPC2]|uniref:phosphoribosylanthranilate isomerase n=1 Tax=Methylococcus sp. EFPC2 TaxID=2812648 RepID=UPI001967B56D|nr:phosphoribosylanthranilate isomerase [Methylococcus sp. EFPC2]QSA97091.1 phosphoribosylanthranilate isomerase [Methylococcus sp. EFPC2]